MVNYRKARQPRPWLGVDSDLNSVIQHDRGIRSRAGHQGHLLTFQDTSKRTLDFVPGDVWGVRTKRNRFLDKPRPDDRAAGEQGDP
jgi:hypothetical protein